MSETHDPWKDVEAELARCREIAAEWGVSPDSVQLSLTPDSLVRLLAARAAEATQHQQEIAAKDAIIKQQAADLKVGGEMQDRETALKNALRELTAIVRGECPSLLNEDSGGNGELSYEIDTLLASPLSAPPQEPTGASPQAEELRAANVANLREMVGMAGRHRETLLAVRECILALSPGHRTGYDWNADPLFLTLKEGRALNLIDDALKEPYGWMPIPAPLKVER